jgi:hypothetical protein
MNRLITWAVGGTLLVAAAGLMIANAQQPSAPAFIAGDRPVTAEQDGRNCSPTDGRTSSSRAAGDISKQPDS